jgi:hypothetical protein
LESGGQSGDTFSGLSPLCTVGAAEFAPPASGNTALLPTVTEFDVFSSPLPDVAAGDVVQAVLSVDPAVVWAEAALTPITATRIAAATRFIFVSNGCKIACSEQNVLLQRRFRLALMRRCRD